MKKFNTSSILKLSIMALLLTFIGLQQAEAQLTAINTTNCWIIVGEQEGPNCNFCNSAQGQWLAPAGQPGSTFTFQPVCPGGPIVSPFPPPPGQQFWIGVKFGVSNSGPSGNYGPGSFSDNPFYPGGACGYQTLNNFCGLQLVAPQWFPSGPNGQMTVVF